MALNPRYNGMHRNHQTGRMELVVNGQVVQSYSTTGVTFGSADPYTVPVTDGAANQILKTDGNGAVAWAADEDTV